MDWNTMCAFLDAPCLDLDADDIEFIGCNPELNGGAE